MRIFVIPVYIKNKKSANRNLCKKIWLEPHMFVYLNKNKMKRKALLTAIIATLLITGCKTQQQTCEPHTDKHECCEE